MEFKFSEKEIAKVTRYLRSKRGAADMKKLNDKFKKMDDEFEQEKRDEIAWWHKIKDQPFTI